MRTAAMPYRPEFLVNGEWVPYRTVFASADECDRYVASIRRHWHGAAAGRSIPSDAAVTHVMTNVLESVELAAARRRPRRRRLLARVAAFLIV